MSYIQVRDILSQAKFLQKFVLEYTQRHQKKSYDELLQGLYREMALYGERMGTVLSNFNDGPSQGLLETWIQFSDVKALEEAMDRLANVDEQDEQIILQCLLAAEERLIELYEQAMTQVRAPRVQSIFEQLKILEDQHLRILANSVSELGEIRRSDQ